MGSKAGRRAWLGWATVALAMTAPPGVRGSATDEPAAGGASVTLNQPVSIDAPRTVLPVEGTTAPAAEAAKAGEPTAPLRRASHSSRILGNAEHGRSAKGPDGDKYLSVGKPAPWYRTGLGALAVVLALIGGLVYVFRRWVPAARGGDSHVIRVVARAGLSPKHSAALLRVGRRFVLVGMSGERLSALCEISAAEEVAELALRIDAPFAREAESFDRLLVQEAAAYRGALHEEVREAPPQAAKAGWARKPLYDLLARLRALQSVRQPGR